MCSPLSPYCVFSPITLSPRLPLLVTPPATSKPSWAHGLFLGGRTLLAYLGLRNLMCRKIRHTYKEIRCFVPNVLQYWAYPQMLSKIAIPITLICFSVSFKTD
ncbi:hypothetical protein DdX_02391 [Ditylenchus destructor]|uniref:Uncharacterized protein n=1 Tax=Ditylenchus destructor TaxID=166010 RepID=A0AAD4R920_9BILA|nr:hypothetical protein DdX_02391 [Ditylenchus destructor]